MGGLRGEEARNFLRSRGVPGVSRRTGVPWDARGPRSQS